MKKNIGLIAGITLILLVVTKSLYVEWTELFIIVSSLSVISIIINKQQRKLSLILGRSALIGFLFFFLFGVIDLTADHILYFLPAGNEDGMPLSLGMKMHEYRDDLFAAGVVSMISVLTITSLASLIRKLAATNHKADY